MQSLWSNATWVKTPWRSCLSGHLIQHETCELFSRACTSVITSHCKTSKGFADTEGECGFLHSCNVFLTFYPQTYLWYRACSSIKRQQLCFWSWHLILYISPEKSSKSQCWKGVKINVFLSFQKVMNTLCQYKKEKLNAVIFSFFPSVFPVARISCTKWFYNSGLLNTFQNFDGPFGWHTSHNKAKYCGESEHKEENGSVLEERRQQALNLSHPTKDKEGGLGSCPLSTFQIMCLFSVLQGSNNWNVINWVNEKKSCIFSTRDRFF